MTKDEAMKLALEALVFNQANWQGKDKAITAIKEALAQPDEDYKRGYDDAMNWKVQNHLEHLPSKEQAPMNYYRADAKGSLERTDIHFAQPKQDWVERERAVGYREGHMAALAQRTWVGLRDDEIYFVLENLQVMHHRPPTTDSRVIFAQAIEAKLKEKNT